MHEAVNEDAGGEVEVIEVASWVVSGLSSLAIAEGAGVCLKSEGDAENKEGTRGSEMCRRSEGTNECGEEERGSDDDLKESLLLQCSKRNLCSCGQNVRGFSYANAPRAHRNTSSNGKGMSSGWKG